jgi:hypothetical protein
MSLPEPERIDLGKVRTERLASRPSKVEHDMLVKPATAGDSLRAFLLNLPRQLGGMQLRGLVGAIVLAQRKGLPVIFGCGAHLVKLGLGPHLCRLIDSGIITHIAANGAFFIHDWELARAGKTSEDVASALLEGEFGMAEETAVEMNQAIVDGVKQGWGAGFALGKRLLELGGPYIESNVLATAAKAGIGITTHIAIGAEIIHQHPSFSGAAWGEGSHRDFRQLAAEISRMGDGGVYVNVGSAVVLPEVFLKALSVAKNQNPKLGNIVTANLDMIRHYRPTQNVLKRPGLLGGQAYEITGQLEFVLPLLCYGIMEELHDPWVDAK